MTFREVVRARADDADGAACRGPCALGGDGQLLLAGEPRAGDRRGVRHDLGGRALRDDRAAVHAGAGAHVDDVVGGEDRLAIVLDDDDGVAEIAQARLRLDQARVVARVEAHDGLVEHVEHADERRADLRGEADALPLADESVCALRSSVR